MSSSSADWTAGVVHALPTGTCAASTKLGWRSWRVGSAKATAPWLAVICEMLLAPRSPPPCRKTTSGTASPRRPARVGLEEPEVQARAGRVGVGHACEVVHDRAEH